MKKESITTQRVFFSILIFYSLLFLPALFWSDYFDTLLGRIVTFPLMSVYLFDTLGIPGLLRHEGDCGWGLCEATWFGRLFVALFWLAIAWLIAKGINRIANGKGGND